MLNSQTLNKIGFYGSLIGSGTNHGYGYSATELIYAWQRKKMPVWWADGEAAVAFSFVQPHLYEYTKQRVNIGYTPWESTKIPEAWPFYINKMTELWTTSNACKEWYEASGKIEVPIRVLHHGINREHFPIKKRNLGEETFKFLHIGEPAPRKGGQMVFDAFKKAFGNDPTTKLVIKGEPRFEVDQDNIVVIDQMLSQEDLLDLYHRCHAFLYPSNGEGFGLLPFQAAATGMPTLVTEWGGSLDYIDYCWPLKVKDLIECDYEPHEGTWAEPDFDALVEWMITVRNAPDYFFEEAHEAALNMDHYWSWDYQAEISLNWFREILGCY